MAIVSVLALAGCVSDAGGLAGDDLAALEEVRAVPAEHDTIQQAVDAAEPGDLVLVSPGVYHEAIDVTTEDIVLRGADRNEVILDGEGELENGVQVLETDGVAVENMTARNYTTNGFFWVGVDRYRGSYLTAYDNGSYGIYAYESTTGTFERSYVSGSQDAGFYIGQCHPCNALITQVVAEHNGSGYSGTNAGGDLLIVDSVFRNNRTGITPNSASYEGDPPERETTIAGNLVHDNNAVLVRDDPSLFAGGNGIVVAGGADNLIERNLVFDHDKAGIATVVVPDIEQRWWPTGNVVRDNVVEGSGLADLVVVDQDDGGNCFSGNTHGSSAPHNIEDLMPCEGDGTGDRGDGALDPAATASVDAPAELASGPRPRPGPQENMPAAVAQPWEPAGAPAEVDLSTIDVPEWP